MNVTIHDTLTEEAREIRKKVFIDEQGFQDEYDETDNRSVHFVLSDNGLPVATCRVFREHNMDAYTLGRLAVIREYRGKNIGSLLMQEAEKYVKSQGGTAIILHSQCRASGFYEKLGFVKFGDIEDDQGCPHIWMKKELSMKKETSIIKETSIKKETSMKITIIHGQSHQGSTCHIARSLARKLGGEVTEFFLPRDFCEFCVGCTACFAVSETKCPHYARLSPITQALDDADVIILASPVYVYHATGAMKAFLDHYGWRWMVHRPEPKMFSKQAVCISTAAGAGMKSTNRDMADSTFFWGVAKTYRYGAAVMETSWKRVSRKKKHKIDRQLALLARKIQKNHGHVRPSLKTKLFFHAMRLMQRCGWNPADTDYWKAQGWSGKKRPW